MDGFKRPKKRLVQPGQLQSPPERPLTPYEQRLAVQTPHRIPAASPLNQQALSQPPQQIVTPEPYTQNVFNQPQESLPDIQLDDQKPVLVRKKRHVVRNVFVSLLVVIIIAVGLGALWLQDSLKPVNNTDTVGKDFSVEKGETLSDISARLEQYGLIKNRYAFQLYARVTKQTNVAEGNCVVKASETPDQILAKLAKGCNEFKSIMFYPGATIEKPLYKPSHAELDQTMYVKHVLGKAGYTDQQIEQALSQQYTGPLFADKPAGASLEGYIYGETYHVDTTASAEKVLQMAFDQMYKDITANDLVPKFKAQGLNLYQAITLASIVQRELNCEGKPTEERKQRCYGYQQTIAQVFLKRLKDGTTLGSDVTFIYAADMKGVAPTPNLDSLYNTRIHPGLPPGPIASPGLLALKAVGNPSNTEYNFFIAGDDGLIYFAKTLAEHEANIAKHCQTLCNDL